MTFFGPQSLYGEPVGICEAFCKSVLSIDSAKVNSAYNLSDGLTPRHVTAV